MRPRKAIAQIREITQLLYDGYGEDIYPEEQLDMIRTVLERVKKDKHK